VATPDTTSLTFERVNAFDTVKVYHFLWILEQRRIFFPAQH